MTKFGLFPKTETPLFCLNQPLFYFPHHHKEMVCDLMESYGQWLLRSPGSHRRTKVTYLNQMLCKKAALPLDGHYTTMII